MKLALYPHLQVTHIKNPNRFYAVPFIGILVKVLMVIPQLIEVCLLGIAVYIFSIVNSFNVLITGENIKEYVNFFRGVVQLITKVQMFIVGLTDKYPSFSLKSDDPSIKIDMSVDNKPNRLFAIPIFGGLARLILLIPFIIWSQVIRAGAQIGVIVSFAPVLFNGKYPETTYELFRDYTRLQLASAMFMGGLQDDYPSFDISKNHMTAKIVLIVIGLLLGIASGANGQNTARNNRLNNPQSQYEYHNYQDYQNNNFNDYR